MVTVDLMIFFPFFLSLSFFLYISSLHSVPPPPNCDVSAKNKINGKIYNKILETKLRFICDISRDHHRLINIFSFVLHQTRLIPWIYSSIPKKNIHHQTSLQICIRINR